ncbi:NBR1-Ig-like domain-containing protein, partial [Pseudoduganella plicata]
MIRWLMLALLILGAGGASAQVNFFNPAISATSGTADASGVFRVTFSGNASAQDRFDAVNQILVAEGESFLDAVDYEVVYDPNIEGYVNTVRSIRNTVALTPGTHTLRLIARTERGSEAGTQYFVVNVAAAPTAPATRGATVTAQSIPSAMSAGQAYAVSVTMKNTGNVTWTVGGQDPYALGSQNPANNTIWHPGRVAVATAVAPGASYTFNFTVTAPATPGTYDMQWQMLQENQAWFGDFVHAPITVTEALPTVSLTSPANGARFTTTTTTATVALTGSAAGTAGATIARLEFFDGGTSLGYVASTSISLSKALAVGSHTIELRATDSRGKTRSAFSTITVAGPAPTATLTAPLNNSAYVISSGSTVNVQVTGTVSTGATITKLEVLDGATPIHTTSGTSINVALALAAGKHALQLRATDNAGQVGTSAVSTVTVAASTAGDAAGFVSQTMPAALRAGQPVTFSVSMVNTGTTTWSEGASFRLGSQNPQDNRVWGGRVYLTGSVAPGQTGTFTATVTAPQTAGTYNFQWQMVHEDVTWFGAKTDNLSVTVTAGAGPTATLTGTPTNVRVSGTGTAAVTLTGNGSRSGGVVSKLELFQANATGMYAAAPVKTVTGSTASLAMSAPVNLAAGIHFFKLRSTDSAGLQTESRPVIVNVTNSALLGTIGGVRTNAAGTAELYGWTCQSGSTTPLNYKVLLDAPSLGSGGTELTTGVANVATELDNASVQSQCATPGTAHHFVVNLSTYIAQYAGRRLYVWAETANKALNVSLPCVDNNCTMPGTTRVGITTPTANATYVYPNPAFLKMKLTNYSGTFDEVGFYVNGQWIAAQPDGAAGEYSVQKTGLAVSTAPYTVYAVARQGSTAIQSAVVPFFVSAASTITINAPTAGAELTTGIAQTLTATVSGTVQSVRFLANNAEVASAVNSGGRWVGNWSPMAAGTYSLIARAYDGTGAQIGQSAAVSVTVKAGTTSGVPKPVTIAPPHLGNADAGSLPGSLAVANDGAATYGMELTVPPGTAGLQPQLSLNYSGNAPNSQLGLGWSLGGLSTITRCGKTIAQDGVNGRIGYDNADRLCLDGQRLKLVNLPQTEANYWAANAEFRTESETFSRIRAVEVGGKRSYKVETRDGRILTYGAQSGYVTPVIGTPNSGVLGAAIGPKAGARAWALDSVTDRVGNYINFSYTLDSSTGEHLVAAIRYGGNGKPAHAAVEFTYAIRNDAWTRYLDETRADIRKRLVSIKTYHGTDLTGSLSNGTLVRTYTLDYEYSPTSGRSLLNRVTACARNPQSGASECLPATRFDWGKPDPGKTPGFVSKGMWANGPIMTTNNPAAAANTIFPPSANHLEYFSFSDFGNDGLTDVLEKRVAGPVPDDLDSYAQRSRDANNPLPPGTLRSQYRYFHNTGSGFAQYNYNVNVGGANVNFAVLDVGDFNGDGAPDLLVGTQSSGTKICLSPLGAAGSMPAAGGTITFVCNNWPAVGENRGSEMPYVVDANGDGKMGHYSAYKLDGTATFCAGSSCITDTNPPVSVLTPPVADSAQMMLQPLRDYASFTQMVDMTGIGRPTDVRWTQAYAYRFVDTDGTVSNEYTWLNPQAAVVVTDLGVAGSQATRDFRSYVYPEVTPCTDSLECRPYLFDYPATGGTLSADFNASGYNGVAFGYMGIDSSLRKLKAPEFTVCNSTGRALDCAVRRKYSGSAYQAVLAVGNFVGDGAPSILTSSVTFDVHGVATRTGNLQVCRLLGDDTTGGTAAADNNMVCTPWAGVTYPREIGSLAQDRVLFLDLLGTGSAQLLYYHSGKFVNKVWQEDGRWELFAPVDVARDNEALDRIVQVTNGLGATSSVQYLDGIAANVVTLSGTSTLAYPARVARSPGKVVGRMLTDNGVAGTRTVSYRYQDPGLDVSGRGALGFAKIETIDEQKGLTTATRYAQQWPHTGTMLEQTIRTNAGVLLQESKHVLQTQGIAQANGSTSTLPYVDTTTVRRIDPLGVDLGTVVTKNTYGDGWGNLTANSTTTSLSAAGSPAYVTSSATTFRNDGASWLIGKPTLSRVTKTDPETGSITRTVSNDYDATTGLMKQEVREPDNATLKVTTTFDRSANAFGLVNVRTEAWTDPYDAKAKTRQTSTAYDANGRYASKVTNAAGHAETQGYDPATGAQTGLTGPNQLTTSWAVDGFGKPVRELRADGNETRTYTKKCDASCPAGATVAQVTEYFHGADRIAVPQVVYSDRVGHVIQSRSWGFSGKAIVVDRRYDALGRLYEQAQPRFDGETSYLAQRYGYDILDRRTSVVSLDESGNVREATSAYNGLTTVSTNERRFTRTEKHNVIGQLRSVTDAKGVETKFGYDAFGNLQTTTDPMGNVINVTYDVLGRRTDLKDPDLGWIHYDVDPLGRTWATTSPKDRALGKKARVEFDNVDRMVARYETDLESHWVYDTAPKGVGQLAEAHTGTVAAKDYRRLHTYDAYGRPSQTTQLIGSDSYVSAVGYDAWGRTVQQKYRRNSDAEKTYDSRYNDKGYLERIERAGSVLWTVDTQDASGRTTVALLGNGLKQTKTFNSYTGLQSNGLLQTMAGSRRLEESYTYDALANVAQRSQYWESQGFQELFTYDGLNRIETSQVTGQAKQTFTYNAAGSILTKTNVGTQPYVYPSAGTAQPHAVSSIGGVGSFGYDANGNQTVAPGRTATWTSFDMPRQLTKGAVIQNFVYGPEHQRARMDRTDNGTSLNYGGAQEAEISGTQVTVKTYWPLGLGLEIDKPGQATELVWTHSDRLGSIVGLTDATG